MTKVLIVAPSAYPLGGVATWIDYLVRGLVARGWAVTVGLTAGRFHNVEAYLEQHPGLPCVEIFNPTGTREGRIRALMRTIIATRAQVVMGVNIIDTYEAVNRLRVEDHACGVRSLMTIHGIQPDYFEDVLRESRVLDGVVCTNRLAVEFARRSGVASERVHYAQYGVPQIAEPRRLAPDSKQAALRLAYVGRFESWQKRVFDLLPICNGLVERGVSFQLIMAGAGPDESELRQKLSDHTHAGRVLWLGSVPAQDMTAKVYRQADILINPSLWETGPIVVWEAMAHGLAVVSSRYVGSGREAALVDGVNCMLYDVGNIEHAVSSIAALADNSLRLRLISAGFDLLKLRYNQEASVFAWETAINRVLAQPPVPAFCANPQSSAGRLDRVLGVRFAESVRRVLRRKFEHDEPGGEWPHSYGARRFNEAQFWQEASQMDASVGETVFRS